MDRNDVHRQDSRLTLAAMKAMSRMKELLDAYLEAAVGEARERGASWAVIAEALGRSRQAVHKQYGDGQ
jgi:hypothetical protein